MMGAALQPGPKVEALTETPQQVEFTTSQAAKWLTEHGLKTSQATVIRRVNDGLLAARRTKGGYRRIRLRALQGYLHDHS